MFVSSTGTPSLGKKMDMPFSLSTDICFSIHISVAAVIVVCGCLVVVMVMVLVLVLVLVINDRVVNVHLIFCHECVCVCVCVCVYVRACVRTCAQTFCHFLKHNTSLSLLTDLYDFSHHSFFVVVVSDSWDLATNWSDKPPGTSLLNHGYHIIYIHPTSLTSPFHTCPDAVSRPPQR